jgi:hypothetical protein
MRASAELSDRLNKLEVDTSKLYSTLLRDNGVVDLTKEHSELETFDERLQDLSEDNSLDLLPIIEARNEISGNVYDVYVAKISYEEIIVVDFNGYNKSVIKYKNIDQVYYSLILINEMEEFYENN